MSELNFNESDANMKGGPDPDDWINAVIEIVVPLGEASREQEVSEKLALATPIFEEILELIEIGNPELFEKITASLSFEDAPVAVDSDEYASAHFLSASSTRAAIATVFAEAAENPQLDWQAALLGQLALADTVSDARAAATESSVDGAGAEENGVSETLSEYFTNNGERLRLSGEIRIAEQGEWYLPGSYISEPLRCQSEQTVRRFPILVKE